MNPREVSIPERMRRFPLWHGYPVHYTVWVRADGTPDFKTMNEPRRQEAFAKNLCHLCGQRMSPPPFAFIGGPRCIEAHKFVDGPMHPECARYAALACPFLSSPTGKYASRIPVKDPKTVQTVTYAEVSNVRPPKMGLALSMSYKVVRNPPAKQHIGGPHAADPSAPLQLTCVAGDYLSVDWDLMPQSR